MSYLALYRKYRSQTFDELVGQKSVIQTLENALKEGKIAHAYLFCGPRGTGKTSIARLFAKALNCEEGLGHQCNKCDNCKTISEGSNPDVVEIDAASNSGVDEVRNLIEKVKYLPIKGRYKVYIIDEVHMMTNSAFNALLKTLEEPPSFVVFILCTTEPYKLLPTILSRCQRYDFSKISDEDLTTLLTRVLKNEKITYDDKVIPMVVELASGGARDSLSLLDQLIAYSGDHISNQDVINLFGLTSNDAKIQLLTYISQKNVLNAIDYFEEMVANNVDTSRLVFELLNMLKDTLIYKQTKAVHLLQYLNEIEVQKISNLFEETIIVQLIDLLLKCQNELKIASSQSFLFEIYLLKFINLLGSKTNCESNIILEKESKTSVNTPSFDKQANKNEAKTQIQPSLATQKNIPLEKKEDTQKTNLKNISSEPVTTSSQIVSVDNYSVISDGDKYTIDNDSLVNIMLLANKAHRKEIVNGWNKLENSIYNSNPKYSPYVRLLLDGYAQIVTDNYLVITYDYKKPAEMVNIKENQSTLSMIIEKEFGTKFFIIGLDREQFTDAYKHYLNLQQLNKLPKITDIKPEDIKIK